MPAGAINAWKCEKCGGLTVARHADEGVTPMFLACRASGRVGDCDGQAESMFYPAPPVPESVLEQLKWEWYRPSKRAIRKLEPAMRYHVEGGGLLLRRIGEGATE